MAFMAFNVDSVDKFTVYIKVERGMSDKDARADAFEAVRSELGLGATRIKDDGLLVKRVPAEAWAATKTGGWGWIANGHIAMDGAQ